MMSSMPLRIGITYFAHKDTKNILGVFTYPQKKAQGMQKKPRFGTKITLINTNSITRLYDS